MSFPTSDHIIQVHSEKGVSIWLGSRAEQAINGASVRHVDEEAVEVCESDVIRFPHGGISLMICLTLYIVVLVFELIEC